MARSSEAIETGKGMDKTTIATLAPALKTFYPAIAKEYNTNLPEGMSALRPEGLVTDDYIATLARSLTTQESPATQRLIDTVDRVAGANNKGAGQPSDAWTPDNPNDPSQALHKKLLALRHYQQIRVAAVDAVDQNTGGIFGMSWGNLFTIAIPKLFKWIFSGFSGGFSGLKAMIAQGVADATKQTFSENLQKQGVDTISNDWGKDTVAAFSKGVDTKVASIADPTKAPPEKPVDLSKVAMLGGAVADESKPVTFAEGDKAQAIDAAKAHFGLVADNISNSVKGLASSISASSGGGDPMAAVTPILTQAKDALVKNGGNIVGEYIQAKKPMDEAFKLTILQRSLTDVRNQLAANPANAASVGVVDGILTKFNGATSLATVTTAAKRDPNLPPGTGMLIDALASGIGSPKLASIIAKGIGDAKLVQQAQQQQKDAPSTEGGFTGKQYRETIVDSVHSSVESASSPLIVKKMLDDKLDGIIGAVTFAPGSRERDKLAGVVSNAITQSVENRFVRLVRDPNSKSIDMESVKSGIIQDVNAALDNKIRDGGSLSAWDRRPIPIGFSLGPNVPYKDTIKQSIAEQINGTFTQETVDSLNKSLKLATDAEAKETAAKTSRQTNSLIASNAPDGPSAPLNTPKAKPATPPKGMAKPNTTNAGL